MHIKRLLLRNFRNYSECCFIPCDGFNILVGKNAQGKSNLIEALYLLASTRSFRAARDSEMIHWGAEQCTVHGEIAREKREDIEVDILLERAGKKEVRINTVRQAKLAQVLGQVNAVFISPQDVGIVAGEPAERRKFLNLEISLMQPQYVHLLFSYKRVVEQRNRLLKELQGDAFLSNQLSPWNDQLVAYGTQIIERRRQFVARLAEAARSIHYALTGGRENLEVRYISTVDCDDYMDSRDLSLRFAERLRQLMGEEKRRKVTLVGPHRDDLSIKINGIDARTYCSYGQQRATALSLRLAEVDLLFEETREAPIVLLDDVMADLDDERRAHVIYAVLGRCQTFATTSSLSFFQPAVLQKACVFTVCDGTVYRQ